MRTQTNRIKPNEKTKQFGLLSFTFHSEFTFMAVVFSLTTHSISWHFVAVFLFSYFLHLFSLSWCVCHPLLLWTVDVDLCIISSNGIAYCGLRRRQNVHSIVSESYAYHHVQIRTTANRRTKRNKVWIKTKMGNLFNVIWYRLSRLLRLFVLVVRGKMCECVSVRANSVLVFWLKR